MRGKARWFLVTNVGGWTDNTKVYGPFHSKKAAQVAASIHDVERPFIFTPNSRYLFEDTRGYIRMREELDLRGLLYDTKRTDDPSKDQDHAV